MAVAVKEVAVVVVAAVTVIVALAISWARHNLSYFVAVKVMIIHLRLFSLWLTLCNLNVFTERPCMVTGLDRFVQR